VDGKVSRISTAQFRIRPHDFHAGKPSAEAMSFQLMQHRGRKNENPSEEIREALRAYHERLTGFTPPRLPINPEAFRALENKASLSDACGYDATDDAAIKGALRLWEPLLPRPLRGLSLDEFAGEIGIPKQDAPAPR
jgi:hypothetical protein